MNRSLVLPLAAALLATTVSCAGRRCCPAPAPACAPATVVVGPAAPAPSPLPVRTSGFLKDYARLVPGKHPNTWYWMKEGIDLRPYDQVLFDPIELRFLPGTIAANATEEQRAKVTNGFLTILKDRLAPYYPVLDKPVPNTLAVRVALTEIDPTVAGPDGEAAKVGGATLEGSIRDAMTGEVYVEFVSRIEGSTRGEIAKEEWRPVEGAFREWADRLLDFLDLYVKS